MTQIPIEMLERFEAAIAQLPGDSVYFIEALIEKINSIAVVLSAGSDELQAALRFLLKVGQITEDELTATQYRVEQGSLQVREINTWLSAFLQTISLESMTQRLGWDEVDVREAVGDNRLYAVIISGELRFPIWQFRDGTPHLLLPGLQTLIKAIPQSLSWVTIASFMSTPQSALIAQSRQTPGMWLSGGGEVGDVVAIIEDFDVS